MNACLDAAQSDMIFLLLKIIKLVLWFVKLNYNCPFSHIEKAIIFHQQRYN